MDAYFKSHPQATEDEAFNLTKKQSITNFNDSIKNVMKSVKPGPALLFLDKVMHGEKFL